MGDGVPEPPYYRLHLKRPSGEWNSVDPGKYSPQPSRIHVLLFFPSILISNYINNAIKKIVTVQHTCTSKD